MLSAIGGLRDTVLDVWPKAKLILEPAVTTLHRRQTSVLLPDSIGSRYEVDLTFAVGAQG